ncbi:uncharacterized protein KY384_002627 [Bacidia gigantensis]|uniref:uncharacterized protein n=1 Tax=Bacidia gigantensis TaxID=2732470 RepID=UPI001D04AE71|nr:uncharacterized protein KY384_002627 [Bacidia gigantensis]KAG8532749.1 hypothetical protein KY384_002627 [Bacidia gigantensis]
MSRAATNAPCGLDLNKFSPMSKSKCFVGKIFRAPVHTEFHDNAGHNRPADVEKTVQTKHGLVMTKLRWMIVVVKHEQHYTAIPLYTHNGTGLSNKSERAKREYVSIRDDRLPDFEGLSKHGVLTAQMRNEAKDLSRLSVAHLTAGVSRTYGTYVEQANDDWLKADYQ